MSMSVKFAVIAVPTKDRDRTFFVTRRWRERYLATLSLRPSAALVWTTPKGARKRAEAEAERNPNPVLGELEFTVINFSRFLEQYHGVSH
jgi:hypothetical protein